MAKQFSRFIPLMICMVLAACSSFGPPESCGENIGGTADQTKFAQFFTSMQLINQTTGVPGLEGENGAQFAPNDSLVIQVETLSDIPVRVCIQHMGGDNKISFDQTNTLSQGQADFSIGPFELGNYVIRVIVDNTLVKNFPFEIK